MIPHLDETLAAALPAFLPRQRWFGGKAKTIAACEVEDAADVWPDSGATIVIAGVSYHDGTHERYALTVGHRPGASDGLALGPLPPPASGWLVEVSGDGRAAAALLSGFADGRDLPTRGGGVIRYGDVSRSARETLAGAPLAAAPVGAEQSNTSLRIGRSFIFKLFRRLEHGENPELEVSRFLATRTSFRAMASLDGSLTYSSARGDRATLGVLQGWIDSRCDGWTHVLSGLHDCLGAAESAARAGLVDDARTLGRITAEFHAALESETDDDAFRPVPVGGDDLAAWSAAVRHGASRVFALIAERVPSWPEDLRRLGEAVIARAGRIDVLVPPAAEVPAASFSKIRIHGDYHLGQTLKTTQGFAIIDFEGEPAIPIARRRLKQCALKDVAGMLRSFDYAIESACEGRPDDASRLRASLDLRGPFLDAYLAEAAARRAVSVPADRASVLRVLQFFEFEKALYEFEYETNNRPSWAHIPLRGLLRALSAP